MRLKVSLALGLVFASASLQAAPNVVVRWCLDDKPSFYFYNKVGTEKSEHPGLVFDLIEHLQSRLNVEIRVTRRPQSACAVLLEKGEVDAAGLLSFTPEREKVGLFPMKSGEADGDRAVIRTSYFLYAPREKPLDWDGKSLAGLKGKRLGAIDGYSIVHDLEAAGVKVETFKSLDGMITRLQKNDIDAVAVNNDMINRIKERIQLQMNDKPLKTKDYFVQLSRVFQEKYPTMPDAIWKESARFLKSPQGQTPVSKYEKLEDFP
ncbi:MAG TPA: transporter substrate-binding domain-containing protein [Oligoflexus sp.]|uniref:substrate-binding periplasmic protein n=1 Tax=Oligoflexus sp. TaxID=1971216 RepID=UPI002D4A5D2D|nr:transporter substrate-binding domain-containing protein [Oligoflexus sp.]HYX35980.1 transporter substrate-binding domain-containing protein [Oligoflexus sp.]